MMTTLFYNPRCSKSRGALELLKGQDEKVEIVKYLETQPDKQELKQIINKLGIKPVELVRIKEKEWKENFKGKDLSDDQIIEAMAAHPRLIERPIAIKGTRAVIGRPPQKILDIL
jgi:arsenate reductase